MGAHLVLLLLAVLLLGQWMCPGPQAMQQLLWGRQLVLGVSLQQYLA